jgi:hypothetical protein
MIICHNVKKETLLQHMEKLVSKEFRFNPNYSSKSSLPRVFGEAN